MENNNIVSFSPHIKKPDSLRKIYLNLTISLLPALLFGFVIYGFNAILITFVCVATTMIYDIVYNLIKTKKFQITDWSTLYTSVLIAVTMPAGIPAWYPILGCLVAEFIIKRCCGGVGKNFVNQASVAKVITMVGFQTSFSSYLTVFKHVKTAEPLIATLHNGSIPEGGIMKTLFGLNVGGIGETAVLFLVIGGVYLCVLKTIDYKIPLMYLASLLLFSIIAFGLEMACYYFFAGGAVLCAIHMLTDFSVCPKSLLGKCAYSIGAGLLTVLIWKFAKNYSLGAYYATLIVGVVASAVKGIYRPKITGEMK